MASHAIRHQKNVRQVPDRLQGGIYMILIQLSFLPDIGDRKCFHLDFPFLISSYMTATQLPAGAVNISAHFLSNSNIYFN